MAKWREQYDRMNRWYERFRIINHGRQHDVPSENYVDEIYAFFLNCYHVKDWIRNDPSLAPSVRDGVEPHISSERSLRLSADICNGLKHLRLHHQRSGENPTFGRKHYNVGLAVGEMTTISMNYEIMTDAGSVDAFQLATEAIGAWKAFATTHNLL